MQKMQSTSFLNDPTALDSLLEISFADQKLLCDGNLHDPHRILGVHSAVTRPFAASEGCETVDDTLASQALHVTHGLVVRAFHPEARRVECVFGSGEVIVMRAIAPHGLFAAFLPERTFPLSYTLRFHFPNQEIYETQDPYRFLPTLNEHDLYLFGEGSHRKLWKTLGAHARCIDGVDGIGFAVWAPNARRVSVVGDFCHWDGRILPMRNLGASGVFELFVPQLTPGTRYKFEIKTQTGELLHKADPFAFFCEAPPRTASRIFVSSYTWNDAAWMQARRQRMPQQEALAIYEVHLGSWARIPEEGGRTLHYREIAPRLVAHAKRFGFTHLELLPIAEHPFTGSWGYQVSGYYAPTARFGSPDDFRFFVDLCHQNGIGVILDWVPAHFPKDDFALRRFDGTTLYEHEDPQRAEHPDWGTLIFNYSRNEVRNFLLANALYWLDEFHIDGLRTDAVASMLYLDYSRKPGEWIPNHFGGRENLDAVQFLQELNTVLHADYPGCMSIAEESTAWPGVSRPVWEGGLGFTFKWNMGWMHDTLHYFAKDPTYRRYHQNDLSFAMIYEYTENFVMPLSHDEVVHGKRALLEKMPGDLWQKFANLRLLLTYQYTRPGKKLLFMGSELAPSHEWNCNQSLDWHLASTPERVGLARFLEDLGALYQSTSCLWRCDHNPHGYEWIDMNDRENSVFAYLRRDGEAHLVVVMNCTPVPRSDYRIGVPRAGKYRKRLSSDEYAYFGSGISTPNCVDTSPISAHGRPQSIVLHLPPLGALVLEPVCSDD